MIDEFFHAPARKLDTTHMLEYALIYAATHAVEELTELIDILQDGGIPGLQG